MARTKLPLSQLFEQIGLDTCVLLLKESAHLEPLAKVFIEQFARVPKRKRDPVNAAQLVVDQGLDVGLFRNLLVKVHSRHQQSLARVVQAARIGEVTSASLEVAINAADSFDERRVHMEKQGVIDSQKTGVNLEFNQNLLQQNFGMPTFENTVTELEDKMRALSPATQEFVDAEFEVEREKMPA